MSIKGDVFISFLKRYRYRDATFHAFLGPLSTLKSVLKNGLISFLRILKDYDNWGFQFVKSCENERNTVYEMLILGGVNKMIFSKFGTFYR